MQRKGHLQGVQRLLQCEDRCKERKDCDSAVDESSSIGDSRLILPVSNRFAALVDDESEDAEEDSEDEGEDEEDEEEEVAQSDLECPYFEQCDECWAQSKASGDPDIFCSRCPV